MDNNDFIKGLFKNDPWLSITSTVVIPEESSPFKSNLSLILGLDPNHLNERGRMILEYLESDNDYVYSEIYELVKIKINALLTIQDVYPAAIYDARHADAMNKSLYFYYESIHLLREYFYCGFNNLPSAGLSIARTVLEFSIRQCYFFKICETASSYAPLELYFKTEQTTSAQRQLNKVLKKGSFEAPIREMIEDTLVKLSQSGSHAYVPKHSSLDEFKVNHRYTLSSLYFWMEMNHILTACLWCYYYTFPMLFAPVDILKKFGFSPPVGSFISHKQHISIKRSLSTDDYKRFTKRSQETEEVKDKIEWYNSLPSMNRKQIKKSWSEERKFPGFDLGHMHILAKLRSMRELLTQGYLQEHKLSVFDIPDDMELPNLDSLTYWKNQVKKA